MTLDDIRMRFPALGFAVYAYEPFGFVTVEVHDNGQVYSFTGLTEAEALAKAFPEPEPVPEYQPEPVTPATASPEEVKPVRGLFD